MTPVRSGPVAELSTAATLARYQQAQINVSSFNIELRRIRDAEAGIGEADRKRARWLKLGFLGSWARDKADKYADVAHRLEMEIVSIQSAAESARLAALFDVGDTSSHTWTRLVSAFERLSMSDSIWDTTSVGGRDHRKSAAAVTVTRDKVSLRLDALPTVRPDVQALRFENRNGPDLWLYPDLVAIGDPSDSPALVDLRVVRLEAVEAPFVETDDLPSDAQVISETWRYVNADGGPDRRFSYNPRLPVVRYGEIKLSSSTGVNEAYSVSNVESVRTFESAFERHLVFRRTAVR